MKRINMSTNWHHFCTRKKLSCKLKLEREKKYSEHRRRSFNSSVLQVPHHIMATIYYWKNSTINTHNFAKYYFTKHFEINNYRDMDTLNAKIFKLSIAFCWLKIGKLITNGFDKKKIKHVLVMLNWRCYFVLLW